MKGDFSVQMSRLRDDFRHSWYFRIWFALWFICLIMGLVALGIFADTSIESGKQEYIQKWEEEVNEIGFPDFHIRFSLNSQTVVSSNCSINSGTPVPTSLGICIYNDTCLHVLTESNQIKACAQSSNACDNRLVCNLTLAGNPQDNQLVAWELDDDSEGTVGPNSYSSVWIGNNNNAWVMLTKEYDGDEEDWDRVLLYHSAKAVDNQWIITTLINSFDIVHEEEEESAYGGWVAVADIGGFYFFLYLLHSLVMILVGFCLEKNSTFLNPETKAQYEDVH